MHRYLYKSNSAGVQDYLCNRLYGLPEAGIERYLSQLCQLLVTQNVASLERVLIALCGKSLRIAVKARQHCIPGAMLPRPACPSSDNALNANAAQPWMALYALCHAQVYWLLTAISQDQPKNKAVGELRDNCERAALEGSWVGICKMRNLCLCIILRIYITRHASVVMTPFTSKHQQLASWEPFGVHVLRCTACSDATKMPTLTTCKLKAFLAVHVTVIVTLPLFVTSLAQATRPFSDMQASHTKVPSLAIVEHAASVLAQCMKIHCAILTYDGIDPAGASIQDP